MVVFDGKFLLMLKTLGLVILLYDRYVDDLTIVLPPISSGWHYCQQSKRLRHDPNHPNIGEEPDKRTFDVLRVIADTIDKNLKFTVDCPSNNSNGRLPVLDLCFWIEQEGPYIRHSFYRKPCAPKRTIMARTALSSNTKRATVFAEGMRRLSSLDQRATETEKQEVLSQYMHTLVMSGYSHEVRQYTLLGLLER